MLNALQNTHYSGDIKTLCSKIYYFLPPIAGFNNIFFVYKKKITGLEATEHEEKNRFKIN